MKKSTTPDRIVPQIVSQLAGGKIVGGFSFGSGSGTDTGSRNEKIAKLTERHMRTWRKLYFGLALLSALFLAESFLPVPFF